MIISSNYSFIHCFFEPVVRLIYYHVVLVGLLAITDRCLDKGYHFAWHNINWKHKGILDGLKKSWWGRKVLEWRPEGAAWIGPKWSDVLIKVAGCENHRVSSCGDPRLKSICIIQLWTSFGWNNDDDVKSRGGQKIHRLSRSIVWNYDMAGKEGNCCDDE